MEQRDNATGADGQARMGDVDVSERDMERFRNLLVAASGNLQL